MLAQAAHDLQAPLQLLSGYLDLLVAHLDQQAPLDGSKLAHDARDTADRMQRLVTSVLDEARSTADAARPPSTPRVEVQLWVALADAEKNLTRKIRETGAHIVVAGELSTLRGDRGQLARLFQNVLENSLKYASVPGAPPPEVRISMMQTVTELVLCIDDNGPGWPPGRERLFQPYVRLHGNAKPGAGLGLAAVRQIVENMGGRVRAVDAPSGGARIEMRFPLEVMT